MPFDLHHYLRSKKTLVDSRLDALLAAEPEVPASLRDAMRYSLLAPGKRLRPGLVFMACDAAGGTDEDALPAAGAVEMIHTYSLVHDDLPAMDDDDLRRGLPTCHKKFGEALAILAGDALLTLGFRVLAQEYPARTAAAACLALARGSGASGMVGGQVEDLAWERTASGQKDPHALDHLERIHAHKTGALFRACLQLGIIAAQGDQPHGPDPELLSRLDQFGHCFGLVFQLTDDLLDVEGSAADTGKRTQKDAARGKLTYPGLIGVDESRSYAERLIDKATNLVSPLGSRAEPFTALMSYLLARKS